MVREYNNVNQDGTYDFGFEYSDGTFKIESKDAEGNVKGSSGYRVLAWLYDDIWPRLRELIPWPPHPVAGSHVKIFTQPTVLKLQTQNQFQAVTVS